MNVDGYCIKPRPTADLAVNTFGSLVSGLVDGQEAKPLPFANFGETPIRIQAGQILGILEQCPLTTTKSDVYLGLAEIFEGVPKVEEQLEGKFPDGWPYLVQHPALHIEPGKADVSDH